MTTRMTMMMTMRRSTLTSIIMKKSMNMNTIMKSMNIITTTIIITTMKARLRSMASAPTSISPANP